MTNNMNKGKIKLNKNKKGFSLVELLVAVAIIAIMTPVLVNGFTFAAKLNYRSRLQQRVDNVATNIYEELANIEYDDLEKYFEDNGWTIDGSGVLGLYYAKRDSGDDGSDDVGKYEVSVAVQKYSQSYVVPDLNLIGVKSAYLTLSSEINSLDSVVESRLVQAMKSDENIKRAIRYDAAKKINASHGTNISASDIESSRILISCGTVDKDKISKQTKVELSVEGNQFVADYNVSYRYPAAIPDPTKDNSSQLVIGYSYSHYVNGRWVSISNADLNVTQTLKDMGVNNKYQFVLEGISDRVSVNAVKTGDFYKDQTMFIYYDPLTSMDWIDIKSKDSGDVHHRVFFIEQGVETDGSGTEIFELSLDTILPSANNFKFSTASRPTNEYAQLIQDSRYIDLYSNNKTIASKGIPNTIYESTEGEATMYRISVEVMCESNMFANVSGTFKAGGNSVGKFTK